MLRLRTTLVLLPLIAFSILVAASRAAAQEATLRLMSPVPGQEVVVRIVESPAQAGLDPAVTVLGAPVDAANGTFQLRTPIDIRLDPVQAFRVTFSTVLPQQLLRVVLTPGAERELFFDGTELVLIRRSAGAVVEMEAVVPDEEGSAPRERTRRAPSPDAPAGRTPGPA